MKPICTLAAAASLAAWSVVAWAQQETTQRPGPERDAQMQTQSDLAASPLGDQRSANKLIGMDIHNQAGEELGTVDDIILDNQEGRIAYAVVSYGGILGIGEKHFAVPWQAFSAEGDMLTLNIDKERLKSAPGFEKGNLPNQADPMFHEEVHEFYDTEPYDVSQTEQERRFAQSPEEEEAFRATETAEDEESWNWKFWTSRGDNEDWARRLSEVIGTEVVNRQNEDIGDIDDIAIDTREGRVTYALVGHGGLEMQTAAVPWNALELDEEQEQYRLDATTEDLELAQIDVDQLDKLNDERFSRQIHEAFDTEPYWIAYGYDQEQQDEFWTGDPQRQSEQVSLSGTIENVQDMQIGIGQQAEAGVQVQLRTESGQTETIHLASRQELQQQNLDLSTGDRIEVEGRRTDVQGRPVIEATEVSKEGRTATFRPKQTGQQQFPGASEVRSERGQEASQRADMRSERAQARSADPQTRAQRDAAQPRRIAGQQDTTRPGQTQRMSDIPGSAQGDVSLTGTIESVEEFSHVEVGTERQQQQTQPLGETQEEQMGLHVQLETETGETEILHISSAQQLEDQNIDLSQGQDVEIEGFRTRYLGEPVIEVTRIVIDGQTVDLETSQERAGEPTESI